jgi:hypothetical protein
MRYRLSALGEQDLLEAWLYVAAEASIERADRSGGSDTRQRSRTVARRM